AAPPGEMQHGPHHVLLHGALRDPVERRDVLLFHVLQAEEDEDIARQLAELIQRPQHLREGRLPIENSLRRALVDERLLDFPSLALLQRRTRDRRMPHRMPPGILEEIRGDREDITFRMLDHLELRGANDPQQRILNQILRLRAIPHTTQEIAEERCRETRRQFIPCEGGGGFVSEWVHLGGRTAVATVSWLLREIERRRGICAFRSVIGGFCPGWRLYIECVSAFGNSRSFAMQKSPAYRSAPRGRCLKKTSGWFQYAFRLPA